MIVASDKEIHYNNIDVRGVVNQVSHDFARSCWLVILLGNIIRKATKFSTK